MKAFDASLITIAMAIWGANLAVAKLGFADIPPLFLVAARFVIAAAILCPFTRIGRRQVWPVAAVSITFSLYFAFSYLGLSGIGAGTAAFLTQLQVPFAGVAAAIVFREKLTAMWFGGLAIALAGTALVGVGAAANYNLLYVFLFILSALAWSMAHIQVKRLGEIDALALNAYVSLFAALPMSAAAVALNDWKVIQFRNPVLDCLVIAYQGVLVGGGAYALWYKVVGRNPVRLTAPFTLVVPLFGILSGVILLGEPLEPVVLLGGIITLLGIAMILAKR